MEKKDRTFLNYTQALKAIRLDLEHYPSQPILLRQLAQLVVAQQSVVFPDQQGRGLWVTMGRKKKFCLVNYDNLPHYIGSVLENIQPPVEMLVKICECVFREHAYPGKSPDGEEAGIYVETGMEQFECRQCGQCCRFLDYHRELTHEDYQLWQSLGRKDILERVGLIREKKEVVAYRIWMDPLTRRTEEGCPWLARDSEHNRYICRIHEVRPQICRQYPGSRKHARMTGCCAFDPKKK